MLKHITIHQRLLVGYSLILGLAVVGTIAGLIIGDRHQRHALEFQQAATREHTLLHEIQVGILYNRPTKQLSPYLTDSVEFQHESRKFLNRVQAVQSLIAPYKQLTQTIIEDYNQGHDHFDMAEIRSLHVVLTDGEAIVQQFYQRTKSFIHTIDSLGHTPVTLDLAQQEVIALAQSEEFGAFVALSEQLSTFIEDVKHREASATIELHRAERLRISLVLASLAISTAMAAMVGLFTSRAIARPLRSLTDVAQRVTQNNNFSLKVPVEGNDEIGVLAISLNQLTQKVNQLLSQLEQKNTDLEKAFTQLQQQQMHLVQSEKMSSLGQLVAGVAHEINNPVNFIHGNLTHVQAYTEDLMKLLAVYQEQYPQPSEMIQTAIEDYDLDFLQEDLPKTLDSMNIGTRRIREIVLSLRNFARMDEAELKPAEIHDGLNSTLLLLQHRIKPTSQRPEIEIIRNYGDLPPIECYAGLLNQVFMNILANAIDALEDKRGQSIIGTAETFHIRIETSLVRDKNGDGLWAKIVIADNGTGMSSETRQRLFDPFFTTKPIGKGTGMGLSICYQIVYDRHEGELECQSTVGEGTEFVIKIPIRPTAPDPVFTEQLSSVSNDLPKTARAIA